MMEITNDKIGKKILLLGNEAITRGALEAGVDVATAYPGTPSSEIADTFSKIAKQATKQNKDPGFYFEYSTNEKVALEVAAAASFCGLRALTCMKHVGLNVASDAFMTYMYVGCKGGHIIVSADDPYCHSSQNEQDSRYFGLFGSAPTLEPTTPQEAKEMTRTGFEISEELKLPILLRTTTRLSHAKGLVTLNELQKSRRKGHFEKDMLLRTFLVTARAKHSVLLERLGQAERISEKSPFNEIINVGKPEDIGIVTSGVSYNYVKEVAELLYLNVRILKLGMTHPLPRKMCEKFITSCKTLVVVEELEPILENQFKAIAYDIQSDVKIFVDAVHHNHDVVITILDNRTTAMTGHQPHPGTEFDGMGQPAKLIKVEDVVKGLGVRHIEIVNPNNSKETTAAFKRALEYKGPSVVVSKSPCILLDVQRKRRTGEEIPVYYIDQEKCTQCKTCISRFGCPAFYYVEDGSIYIDETQCNGCGNCVEICPVDAIFKKEEEK